MWEVDQIDMFKMDWINVFEVNQIEMSKMDQIYMWIIDLNWISMNIDQTLLC